MAMLLLRSVWSQLSGFLKHVSFLAQIVFTSDFLVLIRNQLPKVDLYAKFHTKLTNNKLKGAQILTSKNTKTA